MKIIKAKEKHFNQVYNLICELEKVNLNKENFEKIYFSNITNPNIYYYVAEKGSNVVGFISMHVQQLLHHASLVGEIQEFIVNEELRGMGIGTDLINKVKEKAKDIGCVLIEVCCSLGRLDSHNFYMNRGLNKTHYKFCEIFDS